ncbi:MAG: phosphate acetyltransferase [Bifidobacteriaceae bacterium]|nr:phosphate acetyltransferase [Bifidobacteriaceae bacterium]
MNESKPADGPERASIGHGGARGRPDERGFLDQVLTRAQRAPQRVAFPEAYDPAMLRAAAILAERGVATPLLVGDAPRLVALISDLGFDPSAFEFADVEDRAASGRLAARYAALPDAVLSGNALKRRLSDPLRFAMALQAVGDVAVVSAGLTAATAEVITAAAEMLGLKPDALTPSSVGIADIPAPGGGWQLALADVVVSPDPDAATLADIAINACQAVARMTGWETRCALLSFSTDGSAPHALTDKVREAVGIVQTERPDLTVDGEFQLDAALDPRVAAKKVKRPSPVAGRANVLIFPDLNAGNIGVKLIQRIGQAKYYGVVLQGFRGVMAESSRSATADELVGTIALAVIDAAGGDSLAESAGAGGHRTAATQRPDNHGSIGRN